MSWLSAGLGWIGDHIGGGGGTPDPRKFSSGAPINTGPQALPVSGSSDLPSGGSQFTTAQQQQLQSALSAAGIWDGIVSLGGDVWGAVSKILPKNADGSIDWGGALKDVAGWVKDNKDTILQGLAAYNNYQRTQKSDQYASQALAGAKERYDAQAPLRTAGLAGLQNPSANAPDLSGLKAQGQTNSAAVAPMPVAAPRTNAQNAQALAGPQSGNPFASALPVSPIQQPQTAPRIQTPTRPTPALPSLPITPPVSVAPTAAQLQGGTIPPPFSPTPPGYGVRQPGQVVKPLPVASY